MGKVAKTVTLLLMMVLLSSCYASYSMEEIEAGKLNNRTEVASYNQNWQKVYEATKYVIENSAVPAIIDLNLKSTFIGFNYFPVRNIIYDKEKKHIIVNRALGSKYAIDVAIIFQPLSNEKTEVKYVSALICPEATPQLFAPYMIRETQFCLSSDNLTDKEFRDYSMKSLKTYWKEFTGESDKNREIDESY